MKITEDIEKFAAEQKISEQDALQAGLERQAEEFVDKVSELWSRKFHNWIKRPLRGRETS